MISNPNCKRVLCRGFRYEQQELAPRKSEQFGP